MKYPVGKIQTLMKIDGIFHMAIKKIFTDENHFNNWLSNPSITDQ